MTFTDPVAVFESALEALNAEEWIRVAEHCDPVSLRAFHREMIDMFAPPRPEYALTAEVIMQHQPDMPREVAEYQVAEHRRAVDPAARLAYELEGITSLDELRASEPLIVFASWLAARSPRAQIRRLIEKGRAPSVPATGFAQKLEWRFYDYAVLGSVPDGEDTAQVVFREQSGAAFMADDPGVVNTLPADERQLMRDVWGRGNARLAFCRRQGDRTWCLVAGHQFMGVGMKMIASIG